jgi:predicted negative regulator of RcsB-dependent stress response
MNRPKKNKIHNDTLPDDMQGDDRHLIDTEESEEISFEDRIHLYWMDNKGFIMGCVTVLALAIIGFNGMRIYASYAESKIQSAYAEAMANGALEVFAKEYSNKALGGVAALEVADTAYAAEEYARAEEYYSMVPDALDNDILLGRAKIGLAFATYYNGKTDEGLAQLRAVASDNALPEPIRAEAAYHLAVHADVSGDDQAFESYADQIASSDSAGQWQQRMHVYRQQR